MKEIVEVILDPTTQFTYQQISNYGFNLALLDEDNKIMHTPFECKDYFQDMFWAEHNKKSCDVWGLNWKPGMLRLGIPRYKIALFWHNNLRGHAGYLQELLNIFDAAQGIDPTIVLETTSDNSIVVDFSSEWTRNGPTLSAFTTLIRISGGYTGGDPLTYLRAAYKNYQKGKEGNSQYKTVDVGRLAPHSGNCFRKLAALLSGQKVEDPWKNTTSACNAHNNGICGSKFFPVDNDIPGVDADV